MPKDASMKLGTCSWKYDSWKGILYSEHVGDNYLEEYSKKYNSVEIDQWFWSLFPDNPPRLPDVKTVQSYAKAVPADFKFAVKIPNSITLTHYYQKRKSEALQPNPYFLSNELFNVFLSTLEPLKPLLGPLMFQFEYLNREKMTSQNLFQQQFEAFIEKCSSDYMYAVEIRNPNYLNKRYFEFLNAHHLSHVFLQGYYMPSIFPLYENYKEGIKEKTIIRLHGPDRAAIEKKTKGDWHKIVAPKDDELGDLSNMIHDLWENNVDVHLYVNNHYEGSAPKTIERIRERLL